MAKGILNRRNRKATHIRVIHAARVRINPDRAPSPKCSMAQTRIRPPSKGYNGSRLKHPWTKAHSARAGQMRTSSNSRKLPKGPAAAAKASAPLDSPLMSSTAPPAVKAAPSTLPPNALTAQMWHSSWKPAATAAAANSFRGTVNSSSARKKQPQSSFSAHSGCRFFAELNKGIPNAAP